MADDTTDQQPPTVGRPLLYAEPALTMVHVFGGAHTTFERRLARIETSSPEPYKRGDVGGVPPG
ncbi:MAG: hypothetical protein ACRDI0_13270 [Actinomycetota bacterium]